MHCPNCGTDYNHCNDRACSFHELGDCIADAPAANDRLTIALERRADYWHGIVKRGDRKIYLTDAFIHPETAQADAERFAALIKE